MKFYFIRHGQSQNNAQWGNSAYQESSDPALTVCGHEQAQILAEFLRRNQALRLGPGGDTANRRGFGLTHLYCSLMERAVQTALPLAQALEIPFAAWPETHETGGIYSREPETRFEGLPGKPRSYFEHHAPSLSLPEGLDESGWWNRPFETDEERQLRVERFWAELLERHGDREGQPEHRVALVSHGRFFMYLMSAMLQWPWPLEGQRLRPWFLLNNGSISRFDITPNNLTICYLNRSDYFPDHLITG